MNTGMVTRMSRDIHEAAMWSRSAWKHKLNFGHFYMTALWNALKLRII